MKMLLGAFNLNIVFHEISLIPLTGPLPPRRRVQSVECRVDFLAFTAFHHSLDGDYFTAELQCYIDGFMSLGVKRQVS